jgi:hypothetical protein
VGRALVCATACATACGAMAMTGLALALVASPTTALALALAVALGLIPLILLVVVALDTNRLRSAPLCECVSPRAAVVPKKPPALNRLYTHNQTPHPPTGSQHRERVMGVRH